MSISDVFVYLVMAGVDNCFRCIRISESLGQYFTFPGLFSARELGIVGTIFRGAPLVAESQIHICWALLPMGFGWSLYFAQRINEKQMSEAESFSKSTLVNDIAKIVQIDPHVSNLFHFVHVDNLGAIALEEAKVIVVMTELEQLFSGGGLALHQVSVGTGKQQVLGTSLDC